MTCPYCGSQVRAGFSTCASCGAMRVPYNGGTKLGYAISTGLVLLGWYLWWENFVFIGRFINHALHPNVVVGPDNLDGLFLGGLGFFVVPVVIVLAFELTIGRLPMFKGADSQWVRRLD